MLGACAGTPPAASRALAVHVGFVGVELIQLPRNLLERVVEKLVGVRAAGWGVDVGFDVEFEAVGLVDLLWWLLVL